MTKKTIILIFVVYLLFALLMLFLAGGNFAGIGSDFTFYYDRLIYIKNCSIPYGDLFSSSVNHLCLDKLGPLRVGEWVPSPFYSLMFLGLYALTGSQFLLATQGAFLATLFTLLIFHIVEQLYFDFSRSLLWITTIVAGASPFLLKDLLTSGPVSMCNLFVVAAFSQRKKPFFAALFLCFAAAIRSSYMIYWVSALFAIVFCCRRHISSFLKISFLSVLVYGYFYVHYYSTYPGAGFTYFFGAGSELKGMELMENFFIQRLSLSLPVATSWDLRTLNLNPVEVLLLIFSDIRLVYGSIVTWFLKILAMLGFMYAGYFVDDRSLWIQRLVSLMYSSLVLIPGFCLSFLSLIAFPHAKDFFWYKGERVLMVFSLSFIGFHALVFGSGRYGTISGLIISAFLVRFFVFLKSLSPAM